MSAKPYLKIIQGPNSGTEIQILGDSLILGRDSSSDHAIPNDRISRRHAQFFLKDGQWMVMDLNSKNHTRLNNSELKPSQAFVLKDEDRIQLASQVVLSFHDPSTTISETNIRSMTDALCLDIANGDVFINGKRLNPRLSKRHFDILAFLHTKSQDNNPIASIGEISAIGWPGESNVTLEMVDSELYRLRKRLEELEKVHLFIKAIRGYGRKFVQKTI